MKKNSFKGKNSIILIIMMLTLLFTLTSCGRNEDTLQVHIIDIDQGDSSLIVTPDKKTVLVDSGEEEFARDLISHLKRKRIKKIDYIIGTHYDSDHIGAMDRVIDEFEVGKLFFPPQKSNKKEFLQVLNACNRNRVKISPIKSGDVLNISQSCRIKVLSPSKISYDDDNANSIVFLLQFHNHNLMFTGDADSGIEKDILKNHSLPGCTFLKVAHHGSKTSSCPEFISAIRPAVSTISCGYKNRFGHPHDDTIETLKKYRSSIFRTDKNGTMIFELTPEKIYSRGNYEKE